MSDDCYCAGSGNICHKCLAILSGMAYPYKEYPPTSTHVAIYAVVPALFIGFVLDPMFAFPTFISCLIGLCVFCETTSSEDYEGEFKRVKEYNRQMDELREKYNRQMGELQKEYNRQMG